MIEIKQNTITDTQQYFTFRLRVERVIKQKLLKGESMTKSKLAIQRQLKGYTALQFSEVLRVAGLKDMSEQRLYRIETGRSPPTEIERETIGRLLNIKPWELNI